MSSFRSDGVAQSLLLCTPCNEATRLHSLTSSANSGMNTLQYSYTNRKRALVKKRMDRMKVLEAARVGEREGRGGGGKSDEKLIF